MLQNTADDEMIPRQKRSNEYCYFHPTVDDTSSETFQKI